MTRLQPRPHGGLPLVITGPLINHGGPVQTAPRVYVDFWDWTSDPSGEQAYLTAFLQSAGGTSWLNTVAQYGGGWSGSLLAGTWSDSTPVPASPSDAQIQQEAAAAAAHFGVGTSVNAEIVVATPTGHSTPGFGPGGFCAYHGAIASRPSVTYTDLPYITDAGFSCGEDSVNGSGGTLDGVSIVEGHELAESITDPLINAWYDAGGHEIGDKCAWTGLGDIFRPGRTFAVQPLWSNAANGCILRTGTAVSVANPGAQHNLKYDEASLQMRASGGTPPYTWSASGLPARLIINSSTGLISGLVTGVSSTPVITAIDSAGNAGSVTFSWTVSNPCPTCLPQGKQPG